ncbi:MAG TPA: MliC family protein [Patescibacteria group bacterium]|nr:MliC family protein [Patescibacteria group bacterium]
MAKKNPEGNPLLVVLAVTSLVASGVILAMYFRMAMSIKHIQSQYQASQMAQTNITNATYKCDDAKTINSVFFDDKAEVTLSDGRTLLLIQGISADGVRYTNSDESITFWTKGNTAFVEEGPTNATTYQNCVETKNT